MLIQVFFSQGKQVNVNCYVSAIRGHSEPAVGPSLLSFCALFVMFVNYEEQAQTFPHLSFLNELVRF